MSKSRKKRKSRRRRPNLPPLTRLRPRLDSLLGDKALLDQGSEALEAGLDALFQGLEASVFLPVLLKASASASTPVRDRLDSVVPEWLSERGYSDVLLELWERGSIEHREQPRALAWLKAAGADVSVLRELEVRTPFYQAYTYADESQGMVTVLWYTDRRQRKIRGLSFLIDYNPPWEGAVKDVIVFPPSSPARIQREFVDLWLQKDMPLEEVGAAEVKREILECLEANRREGIRLPRDLIRARRLFLESVLDLPDTPETPSFTAADFDRLSRTGKTPESISHFEKTVGRRVRLEDGTEIVVMGDPFDEDEW